MTTQSSFHPRSARLLAVFSLVVFCLNLQAAPLATTEGLPETTSNALHFESKGDASGKIIITGTSTLHDWEVLGDRIDGKLTLTPTYDAAQNINWNTDLPIEATVRIPVNSLTSNKSRMDKIMFTAMNAKDHGTITFVLSSLEADEKAATVAPIDGIEAIAHGKLTIAGKTRNVSFPAQISGKADSLKITGEAELKMTDFGFDPPTAMLGAIRTGDTVTVSFLWTPTRK